MKAKNIVAAKKKKKKVLDRAKGFWGKRSKLIRRAKESTRRAGAYAYRDRRNKKRSFHGLWIIRINAAARERGLRYTDFMAGLKLNNVLLSRNILAQIAAEEPKAFDKLVELVQNKNQ